MSHRVLRPVLIAAAVGVALTMGIASSSAKQSSKRAAKMAAEQATAAEADQRAATRALMAPVLDAVVTVLPAAFDEAAFLDPERADELRKALVQLDESARQLGMHARSKEPGFEFLATLLAEDARRALREWDDGDRAGARFVVGRLVEDCVSCHSRLPSADSELGKRLADRADVQSLAPESRLRLQLATRQFEPAMDSLDELLAEGGSTHSPYSLRSALSDSVRLAVRVFGDYDRPTASLQGIVDDPKSPAWLRADAVAWMESLKEMKARPVAADPLQEAAELALEARLRNEFPADQQGLVHYAAAARALDSWAETNEPNGERAAQAYYLRGMVESQLGVPYWIQLPEHYLEMSVRAAPGSDWAQRSYSLLELHVVLEYSGSAGTDIPLALQQKLLELRRLSETAP